MIIGKNKILGSSYIYLALIAISQIINMSVPVAKSWRRLLGGEFILILKMLRKKFILIWCTYKSKRCRIFHEILQNKFKRQ